MTNGFPWGGLAFPQINWRAGIGDTLGEGVIGDRTGRAIASSTGSDTTVTLRPHRALVQGVEDDLHSTDIDVSTFGSNPTGGQSRIDLICWKYDPTAKTLTITCVPGSPATSPSPPSLTRDSTGLWYSPICKVTRAAGAAVLPGNLVPAHAWVGPYYGLFAAASMLPEDAPQGAAAWVDDALYRRVWDSGASDMVWRNVNDPPWSTLAGGPTSTGTAYYRVINGGIQFKGNKTYVDLVSGITNFPTGSFSPVGLLPSGVRPASDMHTVCRFLTVSYGGGMCDVQADGNVNVRPPAGAGTQTVSLDGIWVPL